MYAEWSEIHLAVLPFFLKKILFWCIFYYFSALLQPFLFWKSNMAGMFRCWKLQHRYLHLVLCCQFPFSHFQSLCCQVPVGNGFWIPPQPPTPESRPSLDSAGHDGSHQWASLWKQHQKSSGYSWAPCVGFLIQGPRTMPQLLIFFFKESHPPSLQKRQPKLSFPHTYPACLVCQHYGQPTIRRMQSTSAPWDMPSLSLRGSWVPEGSAHCCVVVSKKLLAGTNILSFHSSSHFQGWKLGFQAEWEDKHWGPQTKIYFFFLGIVVWNSNKSSVLELSFSGDSPKLRAGCFQGMK